jgi:hypothetical protein
VDGIAKHHSNYMFELFIRNCSLAQLRNMARMLAEMEQMKQMKSPYTTAAEGIEREGLQLRGKLETVVSAVEQMWNFGVMHDA